MANIFNEILFRPLLNALIIIYNSLPFADMGLAIIILTVFIRFILYPLSKKAVVSQLALKKIQPKVLEVQKKYKDKQEQAKALMALYQENKINPFSGCLPMLIQLPILIALYQVFLKGFDPKNFSGLYYFVLKPESINPLFFGLINLSQSNIIVAVLAGLSQYFQTKMLIPTKTSGVNDTGDFSSVMNKQMLYMMPIFTVFVAMSLPSALAIFWLVSNLFSIGQQFIFAKHIQNEI